MSEVWSSIVPPTHIGGTVAILKRALLWILVLSIPVLLLVVLDGPEALEGGSSMIFIAIGVAIVLNLGIFAYLLWLFPRRVNKSLAALEEKISSRTQLVDRGLFIKSGSLHALVTFRIDLGYLFHTYKEFMEIYVALPRLSNRQLNQPDLNFTLKQVNDKVFAVFKRRAPNTTNEIHSLIKAAFKEVEEFKSRP